MNTLLEALQKGRLIELPENDRTRALQFLAHVIEAIPSVPSGTDVVGLVMARGGLGQHGARQRLGDPSCAYRC